MSTLSLADWKSSTATLVLRHVLAGALSLVVFFACMLVAGFGVERSLWFTLVTSVPWGVTFWLRYELGRRVLCASRRQLRLMLALRVLPVTVPLFVLTTEHLPDPALAAPVLAGGALLIVAVSLKALAQEEETRLQQGFLTTMTSGDAARVAAVCEARLARVGDDPAKRGWLELNLARALHNTLLGSYQRENLERAATILTRLSERDPDPVRRCIAADLLVDVANTFESTEGDFSAMERAVERLAAAARPLSHLPGVVLSVRLQRMELAYARLAWESARFVEGASAPAPELVDDVLRACALALEVAPPSRRADLILRRVFMETMLYVNGLTAEAPDLDIVLEAVDRTPRHLALDRVAILPALAMLIDMGAPRLDQVTDVEQRIRSALATRLDGWMPALLETALAQVLLAAARLDPGSLDARLPAALRHFERAHDHAVTDSPERATNTAMAWGAAAAEHGLAQEAVKAYRKALESARRLALSALTRGQQEKIVREAQGAAAEAAHWLITERRYREAVVTLETSRALLLTDTVEREQIVGKLRALGHQRLADEHLELTGELRRLELLAAGPGESWILDPAARARRELITKARARWEALVEEIRALPGFERFRAAPRYQDVQDASLITPLVYLFSGERGGYALTVVDGGRRPGLVRLPELTGEEVQDRVGAYRRGPAAADSLGQVEWREVLSGTLDWMSVTITDPLLRALGPLDSVTLIPAGPLAALPLHATMLDRVTVAYTPNARVLSDAAARLPSAGSAHLMVADPGDDAGNRLHAVDDEITMVRRRFPGTRILRVPRPQQVIAELPRHSVYHFACHGVVDHRDPLESSLLVSGGRITVKDVLGERLPGARMAVLSACESGVPGASLLDEVVGLPSAMLQAGVPGIIGTLWQVDDFATLLMVMRFYELWDGGRRSPAQALRQAQRWMRDSTLTEFLRYVEGAVPWPYRLNSKARRDADHVRPYAHPDYWAAFTCTGI
ncbi:hypothetical protein GCM10009733_040130 [Nonomuraea maheshkhaliensis]|uniref:CHAT domain-containing protein n=1 Tax=Nonomuraea maheshkhaliensis TaxID=419590 RepID=A0ABN2FB97_9ACTN